MILSIGQQRKKKSGTRFDIFSKNKNKNKNKKKGESDDGGDGVGACLWRVICDGHDLIEVLEHGGGAGQHGGQMRDFTLQFMAMGLQHLLRVFAIGGRVEQGRHGGKGGGGNGGVGRIGGGGVGV